MTLKYEYLGENETKNENILTRWSVTQAGSNYEKNGGPKSRWTVPLTIIYLGESDFSSLNTGCRSKLKKGNKTVIRESSLLLWRTDRY